ncbi:MAG: Gfo/Idh/MocA family oxidoreductase [Lentisphaerae bacterium]|nr:Gfo/Idh/MocA family oxidoreductase [Lentisphaerota bacterium]MCP4101577.1 Gfo/Idh/MocA family oxidoreductase [Lentisphaerota bacterium]
MTKKLRAGVVGVGMGGAHINGFNQHPNVEVVALADVNKERMEERNKEFCIKKLYTSAKKMFTQEKLDIVSIAVPNKFHKTLTIAALESGAHVLCEKPMALNAAEAEEMLAVAEKNNCKLMINFSFRFTPQAYAMKKEVESGILGEIYFARSIWHRRRGIPGFSTSTFGAQTAKPGGWFFDKKLSGGGPLIDLGVHRLDLALWLMGYPEPDTVFASTYDKLASKMAAERDVSYNVEDLATAMIKFKNGATLNLEASWAANIKENEMMETRLLGTEGGMVQKNLNESYTFDMEVFTEENGSLYDKVLHPVPTVVPSSYYAFAEAVYNEQPVPAPGSEGLTVMRLLDAIYASAQSGTPVKL